MPASQPCQPLLFDFPMVCRSHRSWMLLKQLCWEGPRWQARQAMWMPVACSQSRYAAVQLHNCPLPTHFQSPTPSQPWTPIRITPPTSIMPRPCI